MSDSFRDPLRASAVRSLPALLESTKSWNIPALARLLTVIDHQGPSVLGQAHLLKPRQFSFRIGITGPPGAGKSTLIKSLITEFRAQKLSVAVLAVDPSSPFSKGAILGDRIRFNGFQEDPKVFVRSIGSRGSLGGLSASAYLILRAFDHFGFDIVIVETVGVGQTELEIMNVADTTAVVLVPESGDGIQTMKAGLLEIANLFIVNKADREGAESLARELEQSVQMGDSDHDIPVLRTNALKAEGVSEVVRLFLSLRERETWISKRTTIGRLQAEALALLRWQSEHTYIKQASRVQSLNDLAKIVSTQRGKK